MHSFAVVFVPSRRRPQAWLRSNLFAKRRTAAVKIGSGLPKFPNDCLFSLSSLHHLVRMESRLGPARSNFAIARSQISRGVWVAKVGAWPAESGVRQAPQSRT